MPKKTIPSLGAVAAAQADEKAKSGLAGALALIAKALGVGDDTAKPDARMSKRTETTEHVVMEEDDSDDMEEESEEEEDHCEEEEADSEPPESTGSTGSEGKSTGSTHPAEEEEEKAIAKAYDAADKAFAKVVNNDPALLLRRPSALAREARKATAQTSVSGAMGALSGFRSAAKAQERLAAKVENVAREQRETKINGYLAAALKDGKITRAEVQSLKAKGMDDPQWLKGHLAILPKKVRTKDDGPIVPREGTDGAAAAGGLGSEQMKIVETLTATMSPEAKAKFMASFVADLDKPKTPTAARRARS